MENAEIAKIFYEIADMLEIQEIEFKPRAYRKAAQNIESMSTPLKEIKNLDDIPGVGESIAKKIEEILKTGKLKYYDKLKKELPVDLISLAISSSPKLPSMARNWAIDSGLKFTKDIRDPRS